MSGKNKKGKGKSKDQENDGAGAFSVDFGQEKGKDIYIPGSFFGALHRYALLALLAVAALITSFDGTGFRLKPPANLLSGMSSIYI